MAVGETTVDCCTCVMVVKFLEDIGELIVDVTTTAEVVLGTTAAEVGDEPTSGGEFIPNFPLINTFEADSAGLT